MSSSGSPINPELRPGSHDEALEATIKAAEASMKALRLARDPTEKKLWSQKVTKLLDEAERMKQSSKRRSEPKSNQPKTTKALKEPHSKRELPKREQILLLRASQLNGAVFAPWKGSPGPGEFDGELFTDSVELHLSKFQEKALDGWKRPNDALPPPSWLPAEHTALDATMQCEYEIDLVQDAATDCSVVASLCAVVARAQRGHPRLLIDKIYPHDAAAGRPQISPNGKYIIKLNFNGCYRKVVIDDQLPVSKTRRTIHVADRRNPSLLWPALIEKAYLKVRGGYDFPGSNSGTDLWTLTGWIPEQVFLQSAELEQHRLWERISEAFAWGDVLVTMGTGKMSKHAELELGLAGEHDYAVLDMREIGEQRLFLIKNPWSEGTSWKGSQTPSTVSETQPFGAIALDGKGTHQSSRDLLNADSKLLPGTFWMDLDNVVQNFESVYLNWNPGLFSYRQDIHLAWDLSTGQPRGRFTSLNGHPQVVVSSEKGGIIWIVLSRHFQSTVQEPHSSSVDLTGFISLCAIKSSGRRVLIAEKLFHKVPFVDSPQTLMKLEGCEPGVPYTIVPTEQNLLDVKHTFTLSAFGNSAIQVGEAGTRHPHAVSLSSTWTKETAGGNAHSPTYGANPQFAISVTSCTNISLLVESIDDTLNVHVKLVRGRGGRIFAIRSKDIVFDSKEYRRGCCLAEHTDLDPGNYTIVCSTFEPNQLGSFNLYVDSLQPIEVRQLPREGAGRVQKRLDQVIFRSNMSKVACRIVARRVVKMYAIVRLSDTLKGSETNPPSTRSLIRLSIEIGRGPNCRLLMATGDGGFTDNAAGIRTDEIDLGPNVTSEEAWLVFERMSASAEAREERFNVDIFTDQLDALLCDAWSERIE